MKIQLSNAGKRYNRDWIFRHLDFIFQSGNTYAITGPNGSGKSTLLQAISGALLLNEGKAEWTTAQQTISAEKVYQHISICAPYLETVEEFTFTEFLDFHNSFKPFLPNWNTTSIIKEIMLTDAANKRINQYSSGMKQRVKLAQCIFSDTQVVLLDEPCTNLDQQGIDLYHYLIKKYCKSRLVIVSSNDKTEYDFCKEIVDITHYK
jgi:ABC-type multidrug transport system ATPase subunit